MNKNQMQSMFRNLTEQKAPAGQIDLWPAIHSRIQKRQPRPSRGTSMNTQSESQFWRWKPAFILLIVALIGALFFILPQGRALAQEVLHFFSRGESNIMPGPTSTPVKWAEQVPGKAAATFTPPPPPAGPAFEAECGSYNQPNCTVEAIRERVSFPVFALSELPEGMQFVGATGGPDAVTLLYSTPQQTGVLMIWEELYAGHGTGTESQLALEVGADAEIQSVQVGAVNAEYVKGSYDGSSEPPVWNADLDVQMMRWVDRGVLFNLQMMGTEPRLGIDELAALAGTLTDGPLATSGLPAADQAAPTAQPFDFHEVYPLTLAEAEEKAGFALLTPARLPEALSFIGANYNEETKLVELFYRYNHPFVPEATDGLLVRQQLAPAGADCELCGFVPGDGKQVEQYAPGKLVSKDAQIETVKIDSGNGKYLEGVGWVNQTDCCGWEWDPSPYLKRLRFQADDRAVEISFWGMMLTKADIITIAESLK